MGHFAKARAGYLLELNTNIISDILIGAKRTFDHLAHTKCQHKSEDCQKQFCMKNNFSKTLKSTNRLHTYVISKSKFCI